MRKSTLLLLLFVFYVVSLALAQDEIDYTERNGIFANFDDDMYEWFTWDCASPAMVDFFVDENPDPSGINTSDSVAFFLTTSCTWEGVACNARFIPIDFSESTTFRVKVWAPDSGLGFLFKIEDYDNNSIMHQVEARTTKREVWEELVFDFSDAPSFTYHRIALFPDFGADNEFEWCFDDIRLGEEEDSHVDISDNHSIAEYRLLQNYPNPFNASTAITYNLTKQDHIILKIYNLAGQELATLVNAEQTAGEHQVKWFADGLPSGVYFYKLHTGEFSEIKKLVLQK